MTTINAESSAVIERPVEEVWAFVADPRNETKWHTDILAIKSARNPDSGPGHDWILGERLLVTVQFMGRKEYEVEVTAKEAHRRLEITTKTGPMKPVATYLFEPSNGRTRFTRRLEMPLEGPMRLLQPFIRMNARKRNAQFVQNLKKLLVA